MVKKVGIEKLEEGMRICGLAKDNEGAVVTFVNNMLVRGKNDIDAFRSRGYQDAYVIIAEPQMRFTPMMPKIYNS